VAGIILFDVEDGFCAFVKCPTGRTLMIDCGKGEGFGTLDYLLDNEIQATTEDWPYLPTQLIRFSPVCRRKDVRLHVRFCCRESDTFFEQRVL
jgi:hypothetical protein